MAIHIHTSVRDSVRMDVEPKSVLHTSAVTLLVVLPLPLLAAIFMSI